MTEKNMRNKIIFGAVLLAAVFAVAIIFYRRDKKVGDMETSKIKVVTTLFPLYDIARNIGGEKAEVALLLPPGMEAHSFEPRPSDIIRINEADVFVYTGKFMEPWAEDIINGAVNKNLVTVDASRGVKMIAGVFHDSDEPVGSLDSHIWLDFDNARKMAENIKEVFIAKDAGNALFYERAAADYEGRLSEFDLKYFEAFSNCENKEIIYGGHYAFGYMANRYGLKYSAAQGISPDSEPTASDLISLIDQIKKNNVKYIFYEELSSPKIAEIIAGETNTKMLLLNAAHNLTKDQFEKNVSFFDILENNLENLKVGLGCW